MTPGRAATALRDALQHVCAGIGRARLHNLRGASDDAFDAYGQVKWLLSDSAQEALQDAIGAGELSADERRMLEEHLTALRHIAAAEGADARTRGSLIRVREMLDLPEQLARMARTDDDKHRATAGREMDSTLEPIAFAHVKAHAQAEAHLLVQRKPTGSAERHENVLPTSSRLLIVSPISPEVLSEHKRDLPEEPWQADGAAFLAETLDAAEEGVRYAMRGVGNVNRIDWPTLLRGLRAPELDSPSGARERWRRASFWLRGIGFERELDDHVRAEVARTAALPFAATALLDVPRDIRVAQSAIDYGVASDVLAAEGVGRALGFALVLPGMPVELRWPVGAGPAGVLGGLAMQVWGDSAHLQRVQGLSQSAAERVGRVARVCALLHARASVALGLLSIDADEHVAARCEATAEALGRALCCEMSRAAAGLLGANRIAARARAREALSALSAYLVLRERHDQDWFRNPASAETLRNVCGRGNLLSPEGLCEELGTSLARAGKRANELVV